MSIIWQRLHNLKSWVVTILLLVAIVSLVKSLVGFTQTRERFDTAEKEVAKLEQESALLQSQLQLEDEAYVTEEQLRNSLGLSKPGESVVIIPEELLEEALNQKQESPVQSNEKAHWQKWANLFF